MMIKSLWIMIVMLASVSFAQAQIDSIPAAKAKENMGKTMRICDKITDARLYDVAKDEPDVLFTGPDYEHRTLAIIIPKDVLERFPYNPNDKMINNKFCVTGKIEMYKGKPAIFIKEDTQLDVSE